MTMLPDIDEQGWEQFTRERLQRDLQSKIDSFSLEQTINEKIAGIGGLIGGQPQAAAVPEPQLEPQAASVPSAPPATLPPEAFEPDAGLAPIPTPAPAPEPAAPPPAMPEFAAPPAAPPVARPEPVAPPPSRPSPVAAAPAPSAASNSDWNGNALGAGLNAVHAAGGDVDAFARSFVSTLGSAGGNVQNVVGGALTAAHQAGADVDQFLQNFQLPPQTPVATPSSASLPGSGVAAGQGGMPNVQVDASSPEAFIRSITPAARWVEQQTGLPAAAMIGMAGERNGIWQVRRWQQPLRDQGQRHPLAALTRAPGRITVRGRSDS
jgi:flagellum-specific peptidoglycan hydrolase FlgJ